MAPLTLGRARVGTVLIAVLLTLPRLAGGAEIELPYAEMPRHRIVWGNLLAVRYNPLGLEDRVDIEYRLRLFEEKSKLFRDNYLGVALTPTVNPTVARLGGTLTLKPLAMISVAASYYYAIWYGTFGNLRAFSSADADFSDTAIDEGKSQAVSTTGHELVLRGSFAMKLGPVALANVAEFYYSRMDLEGGGPFYYQSRVDAFVRNDGWYVTNDTDLVYITKFGLIVGARNSLVHAFDAVGKGAGKDNSPSDRLGPLLAWVFFDRPRARFNKPTLILVVNWWIESRFRTGRDVHPGIPYAILGFKCEGEIWGSGG